ncbi:MAG: T9SS type A sorting domain-containing protein [Bacteroidales bacterium]|nr:T9SS type A sorting domain-containing protein [Bacteroidales bacterium]MCF8389289.1 T9SS type A sorting domain-containing protein [Bacteroidales bacterium]
MNKLFITILFILPLTEALSQEIILPVSGNQDAKNYYLIESSGSKKSSITDTLDLPFIDDFSDSEVEPNPLKWIDNYAYINNRYSKNPVTAGMATLDSYNFDGSPYPQASSKSYIADYLTSLPINLLYSGSDSVYLSFFYLAKGLGDQPEAGDSLCLEFYMVDSSEWVRVWSAEGKAMSDFKRIMIAVDDDRFLKKGFQFRFLNYASLPVNLDYDDMFGNLDHWHLDYIKLDRNRNLGDTVLRDVSYVKRISSMLNDYESIPWSHLQSAYIEQRSLFINTEITNLDSADRNVSKYIEIKNTNNTNTYKSVATASDMPAGSLSGFSFDYSYLFEFNAGDVASYSLRTILQTDAFDYKVNDTLRHIQVFDKYYAYDDGSAEGGYGLNGQGTKNASVAVHFEAFKPDSLRAVDFYFNQIKDSLNLNYYFYLKLWDNDNGKPGNLIYEQLGLKPIYSTELNKYTRYELDTPVFIDGDFFVGWGKTVDKISNIGFDLNRINTSNNFYNLGSGWQNSQAPGTIMIRPVFSLLPLPTSAPESLPSSESNFLVYPNPADQILNISFLQEDYSNFEIEITDLMGRIVLKSNQDLNQSLNISGIKEGVYILSLRSLKSGIRMNRKILIRR